MLPKDCNLFKVTGFEELLVAIRKLGGVDRVLADRAGLSTTGDRRLFNQGCNSKTLDEMAELLREEGFMLDGENSLIDSIHRSQVGVMLSYTYKGIERQIEQEYEEMLCQQ